MEIICNPMARSSGRAAASSSGKQVPSVPFAVVPHFRSVPSQQRMECISPSPWIFASQLSSTLSSLSILGSVGTIDEFLRHKERRLQAETLQHVTSRLMRT